MEQADCWHLWEQMTEEQQATMADCLMRWADGFNEFSPRGQGCIPNPETDRADKAEKELKIERRKVHCRECSGSGRIYTPGPYHGSDSQCWKCQGEGKHLP